MKKEETKKESAFLRMLAQYSALGGALIGSANQAQATIQYATLSNTPVSNGSLLFSPPGGGVMRFIEPTFNNSVWLSIGGGVSVSGVPAATAFPNAHNSNFPVASGGSWGTITTQFIAYQGGATGGNFYNTTGKFLAFRFNNGGTKYGWLRLNIGANASSFTLVDWAYQDDGSSILTGDIGAVLPAELLGFNAKAFRDAIALEWTTAREEGFEGFSLERATEGGRFAEIAWLPAQGTSAAPATYRYQDEELSESPRYSYRLKSVDLNGNFTYSQVVEVTFRQTGFTVMEPYPNPVTRQEFELEIYAQEAETVQIRLFSATGQRVLSQALALSSGKNIAKVAMPQLPGGIYFLKVEGRYYSSYKQVMVQ